LRTRHTRRIDGDLHVLVDGAGNSGIHVIRESDAARLTSERDVVACGDSVLCVGLRRDGGSSRNRWQNHSNKLVERARQCVFHNETSET
jgi:hypothetical protein